jgi:hypothetical protein
MAELHSTKSGRLPSKGIPGDIYFANDTKSFYFACGDGTLLNLSDLLKGDVAVRAVGPEGQRGERGEKGDQGRPGKDGNVTVGLTQEVKDEIAAAVRAAIKAIPTPRGERGEKGAPGDVLYVGPDEMQAAVKQARTKLIEHRAHIKATIADRIANSKHLPLQMRRLLEDHLRGVEKES